MTAFVRLLLVAAIGGAGCGSSKPPPEPKVALLSTAASNTEGTDINAIVDFRLDVTLANVGTVPAPLGTLEIENAEFFKGVLRVALPSFAAVAGTDTSPLAKDETRVLTFVATDRTRRACTVPGTCDQNPHTGVLDLVATLATGAGTWYFRTDVAITCTNEQARVCKADLAEACQGTDVSGHPLRCLPTWSEVLADRLCGMAKSDTITKCPGTYAIRTIRIGEVDYQYHYPGSASLTALTSSEAGCIGGPCAGITGLPPTCGAPMAFYECGDGGT